jgi:hypothetical protein
MIASRSALNTLPFLPLQEELVVVLVEVVVFPLMVEVVLLLVMEACSWEPVVEQTGLGFDFVVDSKIGTRTNRHRIFFQTNVKCNQNIIDLNIL